VDQTPADPLVGRTVAHYEVVARLGGGGMGLVYAARDSRLGRRVALKFLPPQWSRDESAKERFIREAQAASATDHPNICTIHDIGTSDDGQLFIVMAHYEGETLKARLERGPLNVEEALDLAAQIAEGLAKAHAQGVIHRDIKPGNLMLTEDGVRILDFGLAKFADARLKLTLEGSTIGTIAYMSPEQVRGEEADARSDIWALGAVLYEMLAGDAPFKGGYPEAIAHAIRDEPPAPLRPRRSEVSEALEQLVFRALHKDPAVRFQTARDLARALRRLQGRTLPLDLRTEPLPRIDVAPAARRPRWTRRSTAATGALLAVLAGAPLWIFWPVERIPVAVAPVVNQTGYAELDSYRMALTQELTAQLADSGVVRVLPYERLVQIVRRFRQGRGDVSSREALQAIAMHGGADVIIVPTLLYENGAWLARVEFRDVDTATNTATFETPPVLSSLMKATVYGLVAPLAEAVHGHFVRSGPARARAAAAIRSLAGPEPSSPTARFSTLDAASEFERGIDAYDQQEYSRALHAFAATLEQDARRSLIHAWRSRAAWMMRQDKTALDAAERALRQLLPDTPPLERLLVEAIAAEVRRDVTTAEARYTELLTRYPQEPSWRMEWAAFLDRQLRTAEAVDAYRAVLTLDGRLVRPHLELCRLYSPSRLNDPPQARADGRLALEAYQTLQDAAGEAQARWCLADVLRTGSAAERADAGRQAEAALATLEDARYEFNLTRGKYYVGLTAAAQGRFTDATAVWEQALTSARAVGNAALEPLLLFNLGVAHIRLGNRTEAAGYYQASAAMYEALGDQHRAAQQQANGAALRIEYGSDPAAALRDAQNALAVLQELGDKNFEAFALQVIAAYYRQVGQHMDAERELNRALAILRERNLDDDITSVTVDRARSHIETGRYSAALALLDEALAHGPGPASTAAEMHRARLRIRLGDVPGAEEALKRVTGAVRQGDELFPLLLLTTGELAYERGRLSDAQAAFGRAAALWSGSFPDAAAVEARAYLGLVTALVGRAARGRAAVQSSLEQAARMGRAPLAARCRLFLAQIALQERRAGEALRLLMAIPADADGQTVGAELRAEIHYWRSVTLRELGDQAPAAAEAALARTILEALQAGLDVGDRAAFAGRPSIRRVLG